MKKHYFLFILLISFTSIAQVGIGTSDPKATLDIVAKPDDLSRIDGVIAPRMTGEQLKLKDPLYTLDQTGAIVYVTETPISSSAKTVNITSSGYYYFDGTVWVALKKDVEVPDYNDGAVRMALAVVNPQNSGAVGAFAVASFRFPTATKIDTNLIQQNSPTVF
nr:hypothetical protein [uncultured Flavobacterium sp.]